MRIGVVQYLNTTPMLYGICQHVSLMKQVEIVKGYPSDLTKLFKEKKIDIGILPVVTIPWFENIQIITDYCIGSKVKTASVCLLSQCPIQDIEFVWLDYQSNTSVALCKILFEFFWKKKVIWKDADKDYLQHINGTTAGLVIGDRALENKLKYPYVYDLGEAWYLFQKLPFTWAVWIAQSFVDESFSKLLNEAIGYGVQHIEEVMSHTPAYPYYDIRKYFHENIFYSYGDLQKQSVDRFFSFLKEPIM